MSRHVDAQKKKAEQKANIAANKEEKERLLALGLTSTMKKQIGGDVVLCTACGATQMGPTTCECKGGKQKPGADFDTIPILLVAAKARNALNTQAAKLDNAKKQGSVAAGRAKRKDEKEFAAQDLEVQGLDEEVDQVVEFPVGKLGMELEKNVISSIKEDESGQSTARDLGVQPGWVIRAINGTPMGPNKKLITKEIMTIFKASKPLSVTFRVPTDEYFYCGSCEKFLARDKFDSCLEDKLPGQWQCSGCEEFADMF